MAFLRYRPIVELSDHVVLPANFGSSAHLEPNIIYLCDDINFDDFMPRNVA